MSAHAAKPKRRVRSAQCQLRTFRESFNFAEAVYGMQSRLMPSGKALPDTLLGCVQISVGRVIQSVQQTELGFQVPMSGYVAILVTEVGQHRNKALVLIKDQHALFIAAS